MKFPMNAQDIINQVEKESGEKVKDDILELFDLALVFINNAYETSLKNTIQGITKLSMFPIDASMLIEAARQSFAKDDTCFTEIHQKWFEEVADLGNRAYKQGEIDGYNKALSVASNNSKLA